MKEIKEVKPLEKRELIIKIIFITIMSIILGVSIYFGIYNYLMCISVTPSEKLGNILQFLFTTPTLFINAILGVIGLFFSLIGLRNKTKWIKILYIIFAILFVIVLILTVVEFVIVIEKLKA